MEWKRAIIQGRPCEDVTVYPRDRGSEPVAAVFKGAINSEGRVEFLLPPGLYAITSASGGHPMELREGSDPFELSL